MRMPHRAIKFNYLWQRRPLRDQARVFICVLCPYLWVR